jgi:ATP-binding cassette, subfamily B (MDR/TAP), member 1
VAHRLSTIRDADRILVFYGGRIIEAGNRSELTELVGMYKGMCEAQRLDNAAQRDYYLESGISSFAVGEVI